jgi:hypothetical protein
LAAVASRMEPGLAVEVLDAALGGESNGYVLARLAEGLVVATARLDKERAAVKCSAVADMLVAALSGVGGTEEP